jgi:hypothetical protein
VRGGGSGVCRAALLAAERAHVRDVEGEPAVLFRASRVTPGGLPGLLLGARIGARGSG